MSPTAGTPSRCSPKRPPAIAPSRPPSIPLTYAYDPAGNRASREELDGSRTTWPYDASNQLLGEFRAGTNAYRQTYTYDPVGNRTLKNIDGTRTTYAYDAADQLRYALATGGRTTFGFDAAGNQRQEIAPNGDRTTTTWSFENQPTVYIQPTSARATHVYNADNRRVQTDE